MHGAIYLRLKTDGELQMRLQGWMWKTFGICLVFYLFTTIYRLVEVPLATRNFREHPRARLVVALSIRAIANIPRPICLGRPGYAFAAACATIAALTFLFGVALFPDLVLLFVKSRLEPERLQRRVF